jgi:redox-sensitive bicupin YhaK (pirin superfamily)
MRGFQLWINLPAKEKMKPAGYRDLQAGDIPEVPLQGGGKVRVVAGAFEGVAGPISALSTDATYFDVHLSPKAAFTHPVKPGYNVYLYPYEGALDVGGKPLESHSGGVLSAEGDVSVAAGADGARFLVLAGKPIGEPIVQYGPFVMNSVEEIEQAIRDYQRGALTA